MSDQSSRATDAADGRESSADEPRLHEEIRYEDPDISVTGVVAVLAGIAIVFAGVIGIAYWFLRTSEARADRSANASVYRVPRDARPAPPRLEPLNFNETESGVFAKQLAMEDSLHRYGDSAESGFVHIPIERAMKLIVPTIRVRPVAAQPPVKSFGLIGDGEANSGRLYSEAPSWLREKK
jgi:hypothetical protein